jgi:anthranilate/para-aminobenzoate synthase component II
MNWGKQKKHQQDQHLLYAHINLKGTAQLYKSMTGKSATGMKLFQIPVISTDSTPMALSSSRWRIQSVKVPFALCMK